MNTQVTFPWKPPYFGMDFGFFAVIFYAEKSGITHFHHQLYFFCSFEAVWARWIDKNFDKPQENWVKLRYLFWHTLQLRFFGKLSATQLLIDCGVIKQPLVKPLLEPSTPKLTFPSVIYDYVRRILRNGVYKCRF